jgi:hypothetical protein
VPSLVRFLAGVCTVAWPTLSAATQEPQRLPPPAYQPLRQNEDWSRYRWEEVQEPLDRLKHLDLSADGSVWLSLGGRADLRFEAWDGFGFGARPAHQPPHDADTFTLTRVLPYGDLHLGEHVRVFVEGRSAQSTDRELAGRRRQSDVDTLDLFQGFVDFTTPLGEDAYARLRVGRQSFLFGNQRLVSPLLWGNVWNAWDGASLAVRFGSWSVETFYTKFVAVDPTGPNEADEHRTLYGVYATRPAPQDGRGLDLYLLGNTRAAVTVNGSHGDERRHTLGARNFGGLGAGFDGEVEGAWQSGHVGSASVSAWFASGVLGRRFTEAWLTPRLFCGLDAASGDHRPGGSVGTFHQIHPLGHAYFGFADAFGRQNIAAAQLGVQLQVAKSTVLQLTGHAFQAMERRDAAYAVNGTVARTGLSGRDLGEEVDLLLTHRFQRHMDGYAGYSHVFAGSGLRGTGPVHDMNFAYVGAGVMF